MVASQQKWPDWWQWELDCSNPHLAKRMFDRAFSEIDLRKMLEAATGYRPNLGDARWIIETTHGKAPWEVIVEPDPTESSFS